MSETFSCTRCGTPLSDFWIKVKLDTVAERLTEQQTVESIRNSEISSTETLCPDCFNRFCEVIETGMQNV